MTDMDGHEDAELSALIKAHAEPYGTPAGLDHRVRDALQQARATRSKTATRSWATRWQAWLGAGAAFACGVIATLGVMHGRTSTNDEAGVAHEIVASHVRSLMLAHLGEVKSSDRHTVKPWFSGKLDYSPPVRDLAAEGFALTAGRLDYVGDRPVAALVYRHQEHAINVFVWPSPTGARAPKVHEKQGFAVADWVQGGMQYWAVSDISVDKMRALAQLLGRPPDATRRNG